MESTSDSPENNNEEVVVEYPEEENNTTTTPTKTGKQRGEHAIMHEGTKLPPKPLNIKPVPPTCDPQNPTIEVESRDAYIKGTNIKRIVSITTWDLDAVPSEYNCFWEQQPCILIEALQHYCLQGHNFETPRGWKIMSWKLKQGYPFESDTKLKRMSGLEALERLEALVLNYPEHGRLKPGTKIKFPPALVEASERAAENQKIVTDTGVRLASCKRLLNSRTSDRDIKNLNNAITKYEKRSAIARDSYKYYTMIVSNIKIASVQRLKVLKSTAATSRIAADQQKMDDDFCRSLDIEMEKEALGTRNEGQEDTDSTSRDGFSATTTNLSQYNASTTIQPTNTPDKKPVPITDFARTYQPATDMTYVNEMTLFTEDPSNFNEDIHIVDELISRVVLGSLVKLNRDTKEACKLGANKFHQAELDV
jgi:hypothetical protein